MAGIFFYRRKSRSWYIVVFKMKSFTCGTLKSHYKHTNLRKYYNMIDCADKISIGHVCLQRRWVQLRSWGQMIPRRTGHFPTPYPTFMQGWLTRNVTQIWANKLWSVIEQKKYNDLTANLTVVKTVLLLRSWSMPRSELFLPSPIGIRSGIRKTETEYHGTSIKDVRLFPYFSESVHPSMKTDVPSCPFCLPIWCLREKFFAVRWSVAK